MGISTTNMSSVSSPSSKDLMTYSLCVCVCVCGGGGGAGRETER